MTRRLPALWLLVLAPLVGELLLGNLPLSSLSTLAALPVLALLYGAGAIVIREVTVRAGRRWPTMLVLALAYGVLEEGLVTQSLFNLSFNGLDLHGYGEVAGVSVPWALFVLTIHSVWSIVVPIVLVESLRPTGQGAPWLGIPGLVVALVLYLVGATVLAIGTVYDSGFVARPGQLVGAAMCAAVVTAVAFLLRPAERPRVRARPPWPPVVLGFVAFVAGSGFFLLYHLGASHRLLPPVVEALGTAVLIGAVVAIVAIASATDGWSSEHRFALAAGAVATYCWAGVLVQLSQYGFHAVAAAVQAVLIIGAVALLGTAHRRLRRSQEHAAADEVRA